MKEDSVAGNGGTNSYDEDNDQLQALPECRNDLEYGFVSQLCGFERATYRHIYYWET